MSNALRAFTISFMMAFLLAANSHADIVVIVSKDSPLSSVTIDEISALFLAKTNRLQGSPLEPVDMISGDELRDTFYRLVTKKSPMQMKAYWSRLIFTGKGIPPPMAESAEDVIDMIVEEPDHIGYVEAEEVNDSVKVLLTVPSSEAN